MNSRYYAVLNELNKMPFVNKVLDVGCGDGKLIKMLREEGYDASGFDSGNHFGFINYKGIKRGNAEKLDYADKSFDVIVFSHVLEHVKNPIKAMEEAVRVGKNVIIVMPNFTNIFSRIHFIFTGRTLYFGENSWESDHKHIITEHIISRWNRGFVSKAVKSTMPILHLRLPYWKIFSKDIVFVWSEKDDRHVP